MLGAHKGIIHFTVGQRRGLEIGGQAEPLYVIALDAPGARVLVGPRALLAVDAAHLIDTNRIGPLPHATAPRAMPSRRASPASSSDTVI